MVIMQLRFRRNIFVEILSCESLLQKNDHDEHTRIESDDDDEAGGCKNGNDEIMDLEDMGDYIETATATKVEIH